MRNALLECQLNKADIVIRVTETINYSLHMYPLLFLTPNTRLLKKDLETERH